MFLFFSSRTNYSFHLIRGARLESISLSDASVTRTHEAVQKPHPTNEQQPFLVDLTTLIDLLDANLCPSRFQIDRSVAQCKTPTRNAQISKLTTALHKLSTWASKVVDIIVQEKSRVIGMSNVAVAPKLSDISVKSKIFFVVFLTIARLADLHITTNGWFKWQYIYWRRCSSISTRVVDTIVCTFAKIRCHASGSTLVAVGIWRFYTNEIEKHWIW